MTTFSNQSLWVNKHIKSNFQQREAGLLEDFELISAFRRNKNLKDLLVRSQLKAQKQNKIIRPKHFLPKQLVQNKETGRVFQIEQEILYTTKNCVYLISCEVCNMQYVGETKNQLNVRFAQHKYNIQNQRDTSLLIVQHFIEHGLTAMVISGLQYNPHWTTRQRKFQENQWIDRLSTKQPSGLNSRF